MYMQPRGHKLSSIADVAASLNCFESMLISMGNSGVASTKTSKSERCKDEVENWKDRRSPSLLKAANLNTIPTVPPWNKMSSG